MIESTEAIVAGNKKQRAAVQAAAQDFRKSFADPVEPGDVGKVLERRDQQHLAGTGLLLLGGRTQGRHDAEGQS